MMIFSFPRRLALILFTFAFLLNCAGASPSKKRFTANPSSLSFGSVAVGSSGTKSETITNSGNGSVTISQVAVTGAGFSVSGLTPPVSLPPGQSYTFSLIFKPTSGAAASGSVSIISDASNSSLTIGLSGTATTATSQLTASPTALNFGTVVDGTSKSLSGSLTASGSSVTVSSAASNSAEYSLSGLTLPMTIASGQSVPFSITFTPQMSGTASATISFASNASSFPTAVSLTGSGTSAPQHSVSLSWNPGASVVAGYNIYRSTASGGPYTKVNSVLDASTNYVDNLVQAGQTYYYVTTGVNASGAESSYSNQAQAVIPTP